MTIYTLYIKKKKIEFVCINCFTMMRGKEKQKEMKFVLEIESKNLNF